MRRLTVFTPVYNRAHLIVNLYNSLIAQTNKEFVWLIIDDGSTDNLRDVVSSFVDEGLIYISYYYQENSGKHVAHNKAVELCETELFFCVDSDDILTENAVETILSVHSEKKDDNLLGYYFRKIECNGEISGGSFSFDNPIISLRGIYDLGFKGELAIILRKNLIKDFCFPVFENEKFVTESVFYNLITNIAPMYYFDIPIYIYEYKSDGYTKNATKQLFNNPRASAYAFLSNALHMKSFIIRIKNAAQYYSWISLKHISEFYTESLSIPFYIRFLSKLLIFHYTRLFNMLGKDYDK